MLRSILKTFPLIVFLIVHWLGNSFNYYLGYLNYNVNMNNRILDIGQVVVPETHARPVEVLNYLFRVAPILLSVTMLPFGLLYEFVYMLIILRIAGIGLATITAFPPMSQHADDFYFSAFVLFVLVIYSAGIGSSLLLSTLTLIYAISIIALRQNYSSTLVFGAIVAATVFGIFRIN